ncbi:MAG: hypothetical protein IT379_08020 [Deltaproteobacteria bacterium]|nr:hypothetical protein [Deltaproteobacteria bacterium]
MSDDGGIVRTRGGAIWSLRLLDVADWVDLARARDLATGRGARRGDATIRGPERRPGLVLAVEPLDLDAGSVVVEGVAMEASVRVFDLGVASIRFRAPLAEGATVAEVHALAARLWATDELDARARAIWADIATALQPALRGAHEVELVEDYTVFEVLGVEGHADGLLALEAMMPGPLLVGEPGRPLARALVERYTGRALRFHDSDATVVGWNGALVVDPDGARDELEVLEIASARLLELRYYDQLLARELSAIYGRAGDARRAVALLRSPFAPVAQRAATLFVEMTELYDRVGGAIRLVGDAYSSRLYAEAEERLRLRAIDVGVREKLDTLAKVSAVLQGELGHRRAVLLEMAIILLIVLEVILGLVRAH